MRQRSRGTWTLTYDIGAHADGRRKQRRETFRGTKSDAEKLLAARLNEIATGIYAHSAGETFGRLIDRYLEAKAQHVEPTTLALNRRVLEQHIRPAIGHVKLDALRAAHVQAAIDGATNLSRTKAKGSPLGATARRNALVIVRAALAWAVEMGLVARNVAQAVRPPKPTQREISALDPATVKRILDAAAGTDLEAIVVTAIGTGLRRSELCALRWCDVDLSTGRYAVKRAAKVLDHEVLIGAPKTRGSARSDVMPAFVVDALKRHRVAQAERHLALGIGNRDGEGVVFDRLDGESWHPNHLSQRFSRLVQRKNLPPMRFHDLRHGFASLAFAAGVPLKVVSESLGHSGIAITSAIYVHLLEDLKREKSDRLDSYLGDVFGAAAAASEEAVTNP